MIRKDLREEGNILDLTIYALLLREGFVRVQDASRVHRRRRFREQIAGILSPFGRRNHEGGWVGEPATGRRAFFLLPAWRVFLFLRPS